MGHAAVVSHFSSPCWPYYDGDIHYFRIADFQAKRHMARNLTQLTTKQHNTVYSTHTYSGRVSSLPIENEFWVVNGSPGGRFGW